MFFSLVRCTALLQRLSVTRALQRFFAIPKTTFWWTSIKCIHDNNGERSYRNAKLALPECGVSEWNKHFPEFHSEILGVPREVGLKFRKIGITGKFRSIQPFLLGPSFSEPGNRNSTWLILKLLNIILVLYQTND